MGERVRRVCERILYYRLAYRWARTMDYEPLAAIVVARWGWQHQVLIPVPPIPGPELDEAIERGRYLAKKYGW